MGKKGKAKKGREARERREARELREAELGGAPELRWPQDWPPRRERGERQEGGEWPPADAPVDRWAEGDTDAHDERAEPQPAELHYASAWWPPTPLNQPRPGFEAELGKVAGAPEAAAPEPPGPAAPEVAPGAPAAPEVAPGAPAAPEVAPAAESAPAAPEVLPAPAAPEVAATLPTELRVEVAPDQRRLLTAALTLGVIALVFLVVDDIGRAVLQFGDLLLTFFLAWLVAFVLGGPINAIARAVPRLPRFVAVAVVYLVVLGAIGAVIATLAAALAQSISDLVEQLPDIRQRLPDIVAPIQAQLTNLGVRVDLVAEIDRLIDRLGASAATLVGPLQSIAVASLGALGTTLLVVILSIYIALDSEAIRAFALRLIPPGHHDEWRRFEISVSQAFGGFLRGQVGLGLVYGAVAAGTSLALGLEFLPVTTAATAVLQMVPFFGPFVSWAPPVLVAIVIAPDAIVPALVAMVVGWLIVMNVLQPRVMNAAIGLHPIVVLASVLVGSKVAGVAGAVFGIPVAAVISAMFFYYFRIFGEREAEAADTARA